METGKVAPIRKDRDDAAVRPKKGEGEVLAFLSFKSEDESRAAELKRLIGGDAGDRLKFFFSKEDMRTGEDWRERICQALLEADWLILLFTKPAANWDWPLFEAGFFSALIEKEKEGRGKSERKLICMHAGEQAPAPLQHLESVRAERGVVADRLRDLLGEPARAGIKPLNETKSKDKIGLETLADEVCKAIGPVDPEEIPPEYYSNYLTLHVGTPAALENEEIPRDTPIERNGPGTLEMFGLRPRPEANPWTWGDLVRKVGAADAAWVKELGVAIKEASEDHVFEPIQSTVHTKGERIYLPVLNRRDRNADGSMEFWVHFVQQFSARHSQGKEADLSRDLRLLVSSLAAGGRVRTELIDRYLDELLGWAEEEIEDRCNELGQSLTNIQRDPNSRELAEKWEQVIEVFKKENEKKAATSIYMHWQKYESSLMEAVQQKNVPGIKKTLEDMRGINKRFFDILSRQLAVLAKQLQ